VSRATGAERHVLGIGIVHHFAFAHRHPGRLGGLHHVEDRAGVADAVFADMQGKGLRLVVAHVKEGLAFDQAGEARVLPVEPHRRSAVQDDSRAGVERDRALFAAGGADQVSVGRKGLPGEQPGDERCRHEQAADDPATMRGRAFAFDVRIAVVVRRLAEGYRGKQRFDGDVRGFDDVVGFAVADVLGQPVGKRLPLGAIGIAQPHMPRGRVRPYLFQITRHGVLPPP
jgi:hypothetical protein